MGCRPSLIEAKEIDEVKGKAIIKAAKSVARGELDEQFFLPALQGGAGTSTHMNVNEVIANLATEILSKEKKKLTVHPLDDANKGQSTNDVIPSALKIESLRETQKILKTGKELCKILNEKAKAYERVAKLGRTHLQDAVPITLGDEFHSYAYSIERDLKRLETLLPSLRKLILGGTAVGNGVNASPQFIRHLYPALSKITRIELVSAKNLMAQTSNPQDFVALSKAFTALTLDLSKMANDLRFLSSGPRGGIGEINIKSKQKGSSIMPGKVNPIQLETVNQLHFLVSGNNLSIQEAAHAAQLELSVMTPLIAERLLESAVLIHEVIEKSLIDCIQHITTNKNICRTHLENSTAYATLLVPHLGYDVVVEVVEEAIRTQNTVRKVVLEKKLLTEKEFNALVSRYKTNL